VDIEMACVQGWHEVMCVCVIFMKGLMFPLIRVDESTAVL